MSIDLLLSGAGRARRGPSGPTPDTCLQHSAIGHRARLNKNIDPATALSSWPLDKWGALQECAWLHQFRSFAVARRTIGEWIRWYNDGRPHQTRGYLSPRQYGTRRLAEAG